MIKGTIVLGKSEIEHPIWWDSLEDLEEFMENHLTAVASDRLRDSGISFNVFSRFPEGSGLNGIWYKLKIDKDQLTPSHGKATEEE